MFALPEPAHFTQGPDMWTATQSHEAAPELQVWDLKDLGVQAAQRISQAADPLKLLADISQSFPTLVSSLSKLPVNGSLAGEVRSNQQQIPSGDPCTGAPLCLLFVLPWQGCTSVWQRMHMPHRAPADLWKLPVLRYRQRVGDHQQWAVHSMKRNWS